MSKILEIEKLSKKYKNFELDEVSFSLELGVIMGFVGKNGAGKTTVINSILTLCNYDSGKIKIFGLDQKKADTEIKSRIGFVMESNCWILDYKLIEQKKIIAGFYDDWDEELFNQYAKKFELPMKSKINKLSKGMKVKFSIAIALSHKADLLVLDEPTSGLDPIFRRELMDILRDYIADGKRSILFSTHIISDLEKIADYITFIDSGKIIVSAAKDELLDSYFLLKGDKIPKEIEDICLGFQQNSFGYEALVKRENLDLLEKNICKEKVTIDDLMNYLVMGGKNV